MTAETPENCKRDCKRGYVYWRPTHVYDNYLIWEHTAISVLTPSTLPYRLRDRQTSWRLQYRVITALTQSQLRYPVKCLVMISSWPFQNWIHLLSVFPKIFFDQNSGIYQRNVDGFLKLLRLCLVQPVGQSESLRVDERKSDTQDNLSAKSAPNGSEDTNGYGNVSSFM